MCCMYKFTYIHEYFPQLDYGRICCHNPIRNTDVLIEWYIVNHFVFCSLTMRYALKQ